MSCAKELEKKGTVSKYNCLKCYSNPDYQFFQTHSLKLSKTLNFVTKS